MVSKTGADVVIAGTGIVGCLIAEQMLDAGLSVLMLEAGPRIDRGRIIENYRNIRQPQRLRVLTVPFRQSPGRCIRWTTRVIQVRTTSSLRSRRQGISA